MLEQDCIKNPQSVYIDTVFINTAEPQEGDLRYAGEIPSGATGEKLAQNPDMMNVKTLTLSNIKTSKGENVITTRSKVSKITVKSGTGEAYKPVHYAMKFKLKFPEGLTYVANSGQAEPGIRDKMGAWSAEFTESTKVWLVLGGNYTTDTETKLMTFQFTVDSGTSGDYTVELISDLPTNTIENRDADGNYPVIPHDLIHCTVSINNPATGISVSPSNLSLAAGTVDTSLTAAVTPADSTDSVVWSSSNTAIAQVDSATGKVTAIAPGTAVITAKVGSKSATCNVNVTCTHSLTTIPAKESDCSNNGWHAYQKCTICNELFDTSGIPITVVPYADLNNNHDFDTSKWGYKAADGHATVCKRNSAHHSAVIAHTPDRTAPTEVDPVKCTVCGYTIENALSQRYL